MTDEQFKTWAKSFLERTDTYSSWRGAAVEAIQMLEEERARSATLAEALELFINPPNIVHTVYPTCMCDQCNPIQKAKKALSNYKNKGAV